MVDQGVTSLIAYLPSADVWYDFWTFSPVSETGWVTLDAPVDTIPVHIRGGSIIPMQEALQTSTACRDTPFTLIVANDAQQTASGMLYLDDGSSYLYHFLICRRVT